MAKAPGLRWKKDQGWDNRTDHWKIDIDRAKRSVLNWRSGGFGRVQEQREDYGACDRSTSNQAVEATADPPCS